MGLPWKTCLWVPGVTFERFHVTRRQIPPLSGIWRGNAQDASHTSIVLTRISPRLARIVFRIAQIIPLRVRVKLANAAQPCLYAAPDLTRRLRAPSRIDSCHTH